VQLSAGMMMWEVELGFRQPLQFGGEFEALLGHEKREVELGFARTSIR